MATKRKGSHRVAQKEALAEGENVPGKVAPPISPNEYAGADNPVGRDMRESREKALDQADKTPPPG